MQTPRSAFAAVNCKGYIYAVGGCEGSYHSEILKSTEIYNRLANRWEYVANMNIARCKHASCVLRGKIYVVGGVGTDGEPVKEVECYDPVIDNWSIVGSVTANLVNRTLVAM